MNRVAAIALFLVLVMPLTVFADECMKGDCENGNGKGFTEDGNIYQGEWLNGEPHGEGTLYLPRGNVIEGKWRHGEFVEERKVVVPKKENQ